MIYKCTMCGHLYDESKEKIKFADLPDDWTCPACGAPKDLFEQMPSSPTPEQQSNQVEDYPTTAHIQAQATAGAEIISAGGTTKDLPKWDDILILGAQLAKIPRLTSE